MVSSLISVYHFYTIRRQVQAGALWPGCNWRPSARRSKFFDLYSPREAFQRGVLREAICAVRLKDGMVDTDYTGFTSDLPRRLHQQAKSGGDDAFGEE